MKKMSVAVVCFLLLIGTQAFAAEAYEHVVGLTDLKDLVSFSPFIGATLPIGKMAADDPVNSSGDLFRSTSFNFGACIDYFFISRLALGFDVKHGEYQGKELESVGNEDWLTYTMYGFHAKYVHYINPKTWPYLVVGSGLVTSRWHEIPLEQVKGVASEMTDAEIDISIYILGGVGVNYFVKPKFSLFAELNYTYFLFDGSRMEVAGVEVEDNRLYDNYSFFNIQAGISFWFFGVGE